MYAVVCGFFDYPPSAMLVKITPVKAEAEAEANSATGNCWARADQIKLWAVLQVEVDELPPCVDVLSVHSEEGEAVEYSKSITPRLGATIIVRPVGNPD